MSFSLLKSWDNRRGNPKLADRIAGRTWTRRIQWLKGDLIKLKLEIISLTENQYRELLATEADAQIIWDRFKSGQSIDDSVSILGRIVPESLKSRKG